MNYSFSIGKKKSELSNLEVYLVYLSFLTMLNSCAFDSDTANEIELERAIWNIRENYPNDDERAKAIGLEYEGKGMRETFIKALGITDKVAGIFNADGSLNISNLKEFIAKGSVSLKISDAFTTEMKALVTSGKYKDADALFSLLSAYKNNLPSKDSLEGEKEIIEKGLKEIIEGNEIKDWEEKLHSLREDTGLDNVGQTDASKLVNSEITLGPYDMTKHDYQFGAMFTIVNHPVPLSAVNRATETYTAKFTFIEYKGKNKEMLLVYCLIMMHKFLKEIQDKATGFVATDLRSRPSIGNTGDSWFLNPQAYILDPPVGGANIYNISEPYFPYLLDNLVRQWVASGLTQSDIAEKLKTVKASDIVCV